MARMRKSLLAGTNLDTRVPPGGSEGGWWPATAGRSRIGAEGPVRPVRTQCRAHDGARAGEDPGGYGVAVRRPPTPSWDRLSGGRWCGGVRAHAGGVDRAGDGRGLAPPVMGSPPVGSYIASSKVLPDGALATAMVGQARPPVDGGGDVVADHAALAGVGDPGQVHRPGELGRGAPRRSAVGRGGVSGGELAWSRPCSSRSGTGSRPGRSWRSSRRSPDRRRCRG